MKTLFKILTLSSIVFSGSVFSNENIEQKDIRFGFNVAIAVGGDTMFSVPFEDGSSEDMNAGDGFILGLAIEKKWDTDTSLPFYTEASFNYMFNSIDAENGSIEFNRYPLDFVASTKYNNISVGAGITHHLSPTLKGDGIASFPDINYDDATGSILQVSYTTTNKIIWGLKYTNITYTGANLFDQDGSSFALTMAGRF